MADERLNYTPLSTFKSSQPKKSFSISNKTLVAIILFLTIGVGMISFLLVLRKPIRPRVPAYLSGEATACDIKLGPPVSGSEKLEGNKYSIQVPVENKANTKKRVKINSGWFACSFIDKQTCQEGDSHQTEQEYLLSPNEKKIITVTAQQQQGACGSFQIDIKLKAVKKADDDDGKEGEVKVSEGEGWDESCNTSSTWVGGFFAFPQACGVLPTATPTVEVPPETPTPTPEEGEPTETPTPTIEEPTVTPTQTPEETNTPTPTIRPTTTFTPTPTAIDENTPTPTPGTLAEGPTATPIPVACGTKSCDNTTNPCREGLVCVQAQDGSNYCSLPEFQEACKADPSQSSCCTAPGEPTEIILINATATPGGGEAVAQTTEIPAAGVTTFGTIFAIVSAVVILLGLIL